MWILLALLGLTAGCGNRSREDANDLDARLASRKSFDSVVFTSLQSTNVFSVDEVHVLNAFFAQTNRLTAPDPGKAQILGVLSFIQGTNEEVRMFLCRGSVWEYGSYCFRLSVQPPILRFAFPE